MPQTMQTLAEAVHRLLQDKRVTETGCWEPTVVKANRRGYPSIHVDGKPRKGHRVTYAYFRGPIPPGMLVLHTCDNRACVNPDHLYVGDYADNTRDILVRGRANPRRGEDVHIAKLTEADVIRIRERVAQGEMAGQVAADYGVDASNVSKIARGDKWKHVGGPITHRYKTTRATAAS
jgi:hypothetical protein